MAGMVQVADLRVERGGREVLHGVSLAIEPGVVSTLLGANGAGKSSLVTCIGGRIPASAGTIEVDGINLRGLKPHQVRKKGIAIVSEGHPVLSGLSVLDNLRAAGLMLPKTEVERRVKEALQLFPELEPRLAIDAQNLSGGQKQMVNIAQALLTQPRYLLIDELSFGLAPAVVVRLSEVIRRVAANGVGVLLIEQFTTLALELASRAFVMERGNIVFNGASADLKAQPEILQGAYLASGARR